MGKKATTNNCGLTFEVITVTPKLASSLLSNAAKNRAITQPRVQEYFNAMRDGEWVLGQPLLFGAGDKMIDGQHRMLALIEYGKPLEFTVIRGFRRSQVFGKLDAVLPRKLHHHLQDQGEELPELLSCVIRLAMIHADNRVPFAGRSRATSTKALQFLRAHPDLRDCLHGPGTINRLAPRSMCCFLYRLFSEKDKALAKTFFVDLVRGRNEGEDEPMHLLRERLTSDRYAKIKMGPTEKAALIIKTWNAVRENRPMRNLRWRTAGPNVEFFPEVR